MNAPLVSLIVPVYNRQTSIEVCLKSVLNLEYTHFEVLVIDDGSTDGSLDIIRGGYGYSYQSHCSKE
jgi:glycosyltransferase involved in cell wall biosynthesis